MENLALSTERPTNSQRRHDAPASAGRKHGETMEKSDVLNTQNRVRDWL
jgi:hypothetical protein